MTLMKCFFFDFSDSVSAIDVSRAPALPSLAKSAGCRSRGVEHRYSLLHNLELFSIQWSGRHASTLTGSVTLTHATCACSLAFGWSGATPPKAPVFGSDEFAEQQKIGFATNIIAVLLGLLLNYGIGTMFKISVVFGIPVSFQPSIKLEVAHRSKFLLGHRRAEPESPQFRRVWSMDRTICHLRRVVCVAALQQIILSSMPQSHSRENNPCSVSFNTGLFDVLF